MLGICNIWWIFLQKQDEGWFFILKFILKQCITHKSRLLPLRDNTLHPLIFKEGGLPDNTILTYVLKTGEVPWIFA
jgi:hypothetical protein